MFVGVVPDGELLAMLRPASDPRSALPCTTEGEAGEEEIEASLGSVRP